MVAMEGQIMLKCRQLTLSQSGQAVRKVSFIMCARIRAT